MQEVNTEQLEKATKQIEKYNKDFSHYFLCLKTANYQIKELSREINKVSKIDLNKNRSHKSMQKVFNLLQQASVLNKNSYTMLEQELNNLKEIVKYLKEQQPRFIKLSEYVLRADANDVNAINKKSSIKLVAHLKKLNSNLSLCDKYILPKNEVLLTERKGVQTRLEFKLNNIKNYFKPEEMQDIN